MSSFNRQLKRRSAQGGFTLVELMVALTLFTIVVVAAVSSLYTVNDASRKVQAMRSVLDNLNFAVDSMSRTIRTGTNLTCGYSPTESALSYPFSGQQGCPDGVLSVTGTLGFQGNVTYEWNDVGGDNCATRCEIRRRYNSGDWVSLTAPEINVTNFKLYLDGTDNAAKQPGVLILIQGVAKTQTDAAPFSVQTYVSQRSTK